MTLNIVLVEPQIPQNTGNVARTCAVTGARLHLVGPMGFSIDDSKLKRAGLDYWHMLDISYYESISQFYNAVMIGGAGTAVEAAAGVDREVAPGAASGAAGEVAQWSAPDTSGYNFYYFSTKAQQVYTEPRYEDGVYIFFGSETRGLDEAILRRNERQCVRFPMRPGARSLNLSNSVAVGVFEVLRQWGFPNLEQHGRLTL